MASIKKSKPVGKLKVPAAFAKKGITIDPTRLKPGAWQNRNKNAYKGGLPRLTDLPKPSLVESKEEPQMEIGAQAEICHTKPSIPKSMRRKRSNHKRPVLLMSTSETNLSIDTGSPIHHRNKSSLRKQLTVESYLDAAETSNDDTSDGEVEDLAIKCERNELVIGSQLREIEQLKTEALMLSEWKTGVGEVAVATVCALEAKLEAIRRESSDYSLQIEGLESTVLSLTQQITAYQDEIATFEKDKMPQMESQMNELKQMLASSTMIEEELRSKEEELSSLKRSYESHRIAAECSECEVSTLRRENGEIKSENESYLLLLDALREEEVQLKRQVNDQQLEISQMTTKYHQIENKLRKETVETRQQLQVATHFANDLSDQLEEIHAFGSAQRKERRRKDSDSSSCSEMDGIAIAFGKPLFEKRKTLKIEAYEHSLKLPNMMDMIEMCNKESDDALAPLNEFDVNDNKINEFEDDEEEEEEEEEESGSSSEHEYYNKRSRRGIIARRSKKKRNESGSDLDANKRSKSRRKSKKKKAQKIQKKTVNKAVETPASVYERYSTKPKPRTTRNSAKASKNMDGNQLLRRKDFLKKNKEEMDEGIVLYSSRKGGRRRRKTNGDKKEEKKMEFDPDNDDMPSFDVNNTLGIKKGLDSVSKSGSPILEDVAEEEEIRPRDEPEKMPSPGSEIDEDVDGQNEINVDKEEEEDDANEDIDLDKETETADGKEEDGDANEVEETPKKNGRIRRNHKHSKANEVEETEEDEGVDTKENDEDEDDDLDAEDKPSAGITGILQRLPSMGSVVQPKDVIPFSPEPPLNNPNTEEIKEEMEVEKNESKEETNADKGKEEEDEETGKEEEEEETGKEEEEEETGKEEEEEETGKEEE
eukprot:636082_1